MMAPGQRTRRGCEAYPHPHRRLGTSSKDGVADGYPVSRLTVPLVVEAAAEPILHTTGE
jgi:hypothetical protein